MKWDAAVFKYICIWAVYRGFHGFPWYGRTYNLALEPYSAIPDNLDEVIKLGRALTLMPGAQLSTSYFAIIYQSDRRIKGFTKDNRPLQ
jgi:hypothetical protein